MGSSNHHNDNNNREEEIGDDKESGFARELFKRQDQFGNDIAMYATIAPSRGSNDLDDDDFSNDDKTSNNSDMTMTSRDDNNTYDSADDKSFIIIKAFEVFKLMLVDIIQCLTPNNIINTCFWLVNPKLLVEDTFFASVVLLLQRREAQKQPPQKHLLLHLERGS